MSWWDVRHENSERESLLSVNCVGVVISCSRPPTNMFWFSHMRLKKEIPCCYLTDACCFCVFNVVFKKYATECFHSNCLQTIPLLVSGDVIMTAHSLYEKNPCQSCTYKLSASIFIPISTTRTVLLSRRHPTRLTLVMRAVSQITFKYDDYFSNYSDGKQSAS